jgi:NADH-quinone oxidoreductase subunit L
VANLPLLVGALGIAVAWLAYIWRPEIPGIVAKRFRAIYLFLLNKWYFDELYDALLVRPAMALGRFLWQRGDAGTIDRLGPDGLALTTTRLSVRAGSLQTGYLYHYAFVMLVGLVLLVSWYLLTKIG